MRVHLFVYGTLQDPAVLERIVGPSVRCRIIGPGTVRGVLYDVGEYPALQASACPDDAVPGVLVELDDEAALPRLDAYEGVPDGLYIRRRCDVDLGDRRTEAAWVYLYNRSTDGLRRIAAWPPKRG